MKQYILILILILIIFFLRNYQSSFSSVDYKNYLNDLYLKFKSRFTLNSNVSTFNGIDMVYVVVMPQRVNYITKQIDSMKLRCKYFDAVKPSDLSTADYNTLSNINEPKSAIYNKKTRLPVLLSFVMCFMDALKNGYSTICIFEDDIVKNIDLNTINQGTSEFASSKSDVFFMGYCFLDCKQPKTNGKFISELSNPAVICGHAICYKTKMLPDLIDYCFKMEKPSDELFTDYYVKNKIKVSVPIESTYFDQVDRFDRPDDTGELPSLNESVNILRYCR
jgi:uncharacterized membrane protein